MLFIPSNVAQHIQVCSGRAWWRVSTHTHIHTLIELCIPRREKTQHNIALIVFLSSRCDDISWALSWRQRRRFHLHLNGLRDDWYLARLIACRIQRKWLHHACTHNQRATVNATHNEVCASERMRRGSARTIPSCVPQKSATAGMRRTLTSGVYSNLCSRIQSYIRLPSGIIQQWSMIIGDLTASKIAICCKTIAQRCQWPYQPLISMV